MEQKNEKNYVLRKVGSQFIKIDKDDLEKPPIAGLTLMITGGRVIARDPKNNKYYALSRLIMDAPKDKFVDHINRDPLDNRKCNLRIVSARQNTLNRRLTTNTGLIGVSYTKRKNYQAYFKLENGNVKKFIAPLTPIGLVLAAIAHDKFVLAAGDEQYAPLNFPFFKYEPFKTFLIMEDLNDYKSIAARLQE